MYLELYKTRDSGWNLENIDAMKMQWTEKRTPAWFFHQKLSMWKLYIPLSWFSVKRVYIAMIYLGSVKCSPFSCGKTFYRVWRVRVHDKIYRCLPVDILTLMLLVINVEIVTKKGMLRNNSVDYKSICIFISLFFVTIIYLNFFFRKPDCALVKFIYIYT